MVAASNAETNLPLQSVSVASGESSCEPSSGMAASVCGIQAAPATEAQDSCWYTGEVIKHVGCDNLDLPVATNGKERWICCPKCQSTYALD